MPEPPFALSVAPPTAAVPGPWRVWAPPAGAGPAPVGPRRPPAYEPWLYLSPAHQALQHWPGPVLSFFLEDQAADRTLAELYVVPDADPARPGWARSPGQASFGGVHLTPGLPPAALHPLLEAAEAALRARAQHGLRIAGYPFCYAPAEAPALAECLRQRGYAVALAETNYYLDLARNYAPHLAPAARRRLAAARRAGLVLEQEPPLLLPAAYEFIAACRAERGQPPLSLSLARLQEVFRAFPRQHFLLSLREPGGGWAALTVAIQATPRVLHNFYPATPLRLNHLSPAVLLTEGLHGLGRSLGAQVLDLGRSTEHGQPHVSLLRFKASLGGVPSLKLTWEKGL